jgi:hypothetical protein
MEEIEDIGRRRLWGAYFSSKYKTVLVLGTKKLYWRRVYMNSLNLIYIVIIFLKLKIY